MQNNIGYICTTAQCTQGKADKIALRLIHSDRTKTNYTFKDLDSESNRFANLLKSIGISKQEKVFIFLPKQVEVFICFLGILKIQAIAGILFSNFGKEAIFERLLDSSATILITKQSLLGKIREIWPNLPALKKLILTDLPVQENENILSYSELMASSSDKFEILSTASRNPFYPSLHIGFYWSTKRCITCPCRD